MRRHIWYWPAPSTTHRESFPICSFFSFFFYLNEMHFKSAYMYTKWTLKGVQCVLQTYFQTISKMIKSISVNFLQSKSMWFVRKWWKRFYGAGVTKNSFHLFLQILLVSVYYYFVWCVALSRTVNTIRQIWMKWQNYAPKKCENSKSE